MEFLNLSDPAGTTWELLLVVVVIIAGPVLMERIRVPGLIGLLIGGCILGPSVLGVVSDTTGILDELGEVGLLYLMFVAGLELDLGVFAKYKNKAIGFALLTFSIPLALGFMGGVLVGYSTEASILLGSLWASYTLVVYPILRDKGLGANRAVAVAVGGSPITDTLSLVVLAAIAGFASGDASGIELVSQIGLGLAIVAGWAFLVLPRLAALFFPTIGRPRTMRYIFMLGALLSAGVIAESVGIEPIVGSFFAGLALNRFAPNGGELMEKIEFFGSALLIPAFLISVGTIIDPAVLIKPATLGLAGVFIVTCVGGKIIAAVLCRPLFRFSWPEIGALFGLPVAQAAATLAATFVGLELGLFTTTTVNAVMFVIVVTLLFASISAERFGSQIWQPEIDTSRLGRSVLVNLDSSPDARAVIRASARLAASDGGLVHPVFVVADGEPRPDRDLLHNIDEELEVSAVDADLRVVHDRSLADGLAHQALGTGASMVVVPTSTTAGPSWKFAIGEIAAACPVPTLLLQPGGSAPERIIVALQGGQATQMSNPALLALQVGRRLRGHEIDMMVVATSALDPTLAESVPEGVQVLIQEDVLSWWRTNGAPTDEIVLPGGRMNALATGRLLRLATTNGATVIVAADPEGTPVSQRAADGLGIVTGIGLD